MDTARAATLFKALGDENRVRIMQLLQEGEKCACKLLEEFHFSQPTLSHHMKILVEAELVHARKVGKWMYYHISPDCIGEVLFFIMSLTPSHEHSEDCDCGCC